jgi:beta-lactamase class A
MVKKKLVFILVILLGFSLAALVIYKAYSNCLEAKKKKLILEKRKSAWSVLKKTIEFEVPNFKGEAAVIIEDLNMRWKISFNRDKLFPSASLVKIPIMAACFYAAREGRISLKDKLTLKNSSKTPGSGVLKNMAAGSTFTVDKIIEIMITKSDNTATNMLIELLTFDYLNRFFKTQGLSNTNLSRKMMDFKYRRKGVENYTTAEDLAYLLERIYRREFLNRDISERCLSMLLQQKVNDRIPARLPRNVPVAHKTGLESQVCHDVGILFAPQGDFLICVLTKSKAGRKEIKEFIARLALFTYNSYNKLLSS